MSMCDSSWTFTFWHPGCHTLLAEVSVCLGQRDVVGGGRVLHPTRRSWEALCAELPPFTMAHPSWICDLLSQKPWNDPAQWQGKRRSSPRTQQNPSPTAAAWSGEAASALALVDITALSFLPPPK